MKAVAKHSRGNYEARTRVTFFLPANDNKEHKAIFTVVRYLRSQLKCLTAPVTGYTFSQIPDPVFVGSWWWEGRKQWKSDSVVLFMIDYERTLDDHRLENGIRRLKTKIKSAYSAVRRTQEEIWIITHRVQRFV
jgi:hypothetical protein